jgi:ketosteroid isomerase-like protein
MGSEPTVAIAAVQEFIGCINRRDVDGLGALMTEDHTLKVLDEAPLVGRVQNIDAWRGYVVAFPDYLIFPHRLAQQDSQVAVLGHTSGSHLGLPEALEEQLTIIWIAQVKDGRLSRWQIVEDTRERRAELALTNDD